MSSMRIIRLDIPDKYTPEFFKENIIKIHNNISQTGNSRIRIIYIDLHLENINLKKIHHLLLSLANR